VIEAAPYVTNIATLNKYKCDFCVHGGMYISFTMNSVSSVCAFIYAA